MPVCTLSHNGDPVNPCRKASRRPRRFTRFRRDDLEFRLVTKVNHLNHRAHDFSEIDPERSQRLFAAKVALIRYLLAQQLATGMVSVRATNGWRWHVPLDVLIRAITEVQDVG